MKLITRDEWEMITLPTQPSQYRKTETLIQTTNIDMLINRKLSLNYVLPSLPPLRLPYN